MNKDFRKWICSDQCKLVREWFFAFYLTFAAATVLYKLSGSHLFYLILCAITIVYAPGIIFTFGYMTAMIHTEKRKEFKSYMLKIALSSYLIFFILGLLKEELLDHRDLYATIKDLLALLRFPGLSCIFITICFFALILAFGMDTFDHLLSRAPVIGLICLVGICFSLIPSGLIGYGSIGIFIGGDNYGCIPIATHLLAFCWGFYHARRQEKPNFRNELLILGVCVLLAAVFLLLHHRQACFVLAGTGLAYIGIIVGGWLLPVYSLIEGIVVSIIRKIMDGANFVINASRKNQKTRILFYYVIYTCVFLVMLGFVFWPYIHMGKTLIWEPDGMGQYFAKAYRFIHYMPAVISDLLHGNFDFQQYDFSTGLGGTVTFAFDPIYWLYMLFNASQLETAYSFLILLRFFLAGISMSAMILYFKKSRYAALIGSMAYIFSGYAIYGGTRHGQFVTPMILLPILVIAMERLISKKKWYLLTVFTALSLLCSYYFLYMNTIALGIYYVARILCSKEYRNIKTFFFRGLLIVWSYILGASIGIFTIFLSFGTFLGSSRTSSETSSFLTTTALFYRPEWLSDTFISFVSDSYTPGLWVKLGFIPLALFAIVLLFTRKHRKELKSMFLIFTAFLAFPVCGYVFSGFSGTNNRWSYIYAVLIIFILVENLDYFLDLSTKETSIMVAMTGLYFGIVMFSTKYKSTEVMGAFGLLAMTLVIVLFINFLGTKMSLTMKKGLIFAISMLCIVINSSLFLSEAHMNTYVSKGKAYKKATYTPLKELDQVEDKGDDFYRSTNCETPGISRSSAMVLGYHDISTFNSTLNGGIVDYNSLMGNCNWNIVSIYDYNRRTIMNELASVKYLGVRTKSEIPFGYKEVLETSDTSGIYENEYALPLGYTYSKVISESDVEKCSAAEKQDITTLAAVVKDDSETLNNSGDIEVASTDTLPVTAHALDIKDITLNGCHMYGEKESDSLLESVNKDDKDIDFSKLLVIDQNNATVTISFESEANAETYLSLEGDIYHSKDAYEHVIKSRVTADGVSTTMKFRIDSYSTKQDEYLINLGYRENETIDKATMTFDIGDSSTGLIYMKDLEIYSQPMDDYPTNVNALKENSLEHATAEKNTVTGQITVDQDKMLVITLPYQKGWTAYVDGKKVDIQNVNYQYMGIQLKAGSHDIRLHYQLPGLKYAFLITGTGIFVFLLCIIVGCVWKRRNKRNKINE